MIDKLIEQQEQIKAMQENEDSAIKVMKMYEDYKKKVDKAIEYIQSIDEIEVRYLDKEALYRNGISEYKIQEKLEKDKSLEGHFIKVNKYYLLEILKGEDKE